MLFSSVLHLSPTRPADVRIQRQEFVQAITAQPRPQQAACGIITASVCSPGQEGGAAALPSSKGCTA